MTFTEAALQVLRSAGEPLHYKKIVELAIARNLLSHVGRTPEVTMSSRLATLVKKDRGQAVVVKVRPGVFAIRESSMSNEKETPAASAGDETSNSVAPTIAPKVHLPGADVFPEEDGDDDPILAGIEGGDRPQQEERGRRRRRRRRGRGGERMEHENDVGPRADVAGRQDVQPADRGRDDRGRNDHVRNDRGRDDRGRDDRNRNDHVRNDRGRDDRGRDDRGRDDRGRDDRNRNDRMRDRGYERAPIDLSRAPGEGDLLGKDLADAAYSVLTGGERQGTSFPRIAELLVRRGRLNGSPEALAPTVAAAIRGEVARAHKAGRRSRMRIVENRVTLSEWLLPREALRSEDNAHHAAEQQRDHVRRAFAARLNDLPTGGFAELIATWLNAEGVTALRAVRRPSSSERELHFAGTLRRGAEELRLAIVVLRSGYDIDAPHLTEVRGSLHHYGNASQAWIVTTGRVSQRARDEAAAEHAAPCALLSGADLARTMEALGIGLKVHTVALCDIDFDLLEALGDGGLLRERERERQRERDERTRREQAQPRGSADSEGDGEPAGERDVRAPEIDLLDAEAAEASRLVGDRSWNDEGGAAEDRSTETVADDEAGEIDFSRDEPRDEIDDGSDDEPDDDDGEGDGEGEDVEIDEDAAEAGGDDEREG